jgi:hypothetical protein
VATATAVATTAFGIALHRTAHISPARRRQRQP